MDWALSARHGDKSVNILALFFFSVHFFVVAVGFLFFDFVFVF